MRILTGFDPTTLDAVLADTTLTVEPATLPDDPVVLKQLVMQLFEEQAAHIAAAHESRSLPLLEGFHTWLETEAPKVLPRATSEARWITR